ncbi:MAG TPA: sugar ABC transporter permease [Acidimicrobiia bacterium]|nr:sugar ABC transporter permease [Acidimicrobiia bacterium]
MEKIVSTLVGVVVAIGGSAALFIGANKWFDQARVKWSRFAAITGAVIGVVLSAILIGNRIMQWRMSPAEDATDLSLLLVAILAVLFGAWGSVLATTEGRRRRLIVGAVGGLVIGLVIAAFIRPLAWPAMRIVPLIGWPVGVAAVGAGLAALRGRDLVKGAVTGAAIGWFFGAFLAPTLGTGTQAEVLMGLAILGVAVGVRLGLNEPSTLAGRERLQHRSRAVIFVAPALLFIGATLVIPTIQTLILSVYGTRGQDFVGLDNYQTVFGTPDIFNVSSWTNIFTTGLFVWGAALAIGGYLFARQKGRAIGAPTDWSGLSAGPLALGSIFIAFAVFTTLRGVIWNNLWWVFSVTVIAAGLGLAIAVLADRARGESVAKSLIFMPMAISFVGAGIIWRFMYLARPVGRDQTGVLNYLWVGLGEISTGGSPLRTFLIVVFALVVVGLGFLAYRARRAGANSVAIGSLVTTLPFLWLMWRFVGSGIGGVLRDPVTGEVAPLASGVVGEPVIFLQEQPWNTFWLIIVLIWIQTGFAMVVFSAAIKGVPTDLVEASKVDGATESETFWRVTIPQIAPTIGVVTTTLIVLVMKVFDIPKVMTNGQFGTNVLANEMWQKAFTELNIGMGAALAMILFFSVVPVMYYNIRRQREAV